MSILAGIKKIRALELISGAEAIEKATAMGWQLVEKKANIRLET